jgi:acyl-CoA synthetase (AMP-forming)/AMP-acid ligase II/acyl carrier protein
MIERQAGAWHRAAILAPDAERFHALGSTRVAEPGHSCSGWSDRDRIALVVDNGPEAAVAFCGIAATLGAAPLNPNYQRREFDFFLSDLQARAVVVPVGAAPAAREAAAALGIPVAELVPHLGEAGGSFHLRASESEGDPEARRPAPEDVALLLHTSGTTARPKLVPLTHANLTTSAAHVARALALTPDDRCLNVMPLFHIHGLVAALLATLVSGASVVCTPGFFAPLFFDWMSEYAPTWYTAVPTMHQSILARARADPSAVARTSLRLVRSSSASLPPTVMAQLEHVLGAPVVEAYGMTEAAHQIASNPLPPAVRKPGSVGLPAGPQIAIVDGAGRHLPAGERGEIALRGENVTAGYINDAEANRRAHIEGWLRTGDEGYQDADGYLFITGRLKEQINRGGQKISPREVDEALLAHPGIAQAVTFAIEHPMLGEEVGAAIVLREGVVLEPAHIREFAAARLAFYKVPSRLVIVEEIPKGATGKVQRIGLAARLGIASGEDPMAPSPGGPQPRTPLEMQIAQVWRDVLRVDAIGVDDNFLALGGDSILAAQVVGRLRKALDVDLRLVHFLETPTVASMATKILELQASSLAEGELDRLLTEIETGRGDAPTERGKGNGG